MLWMDTYSKVNVSEHTIAPYMTHAEPKQTQVQGQNKHTNISRPNKTQAQGQTKYHQQEQTRDGDRAGFS